MIMIFLPVFVIFLFQTCRTPNQPGEKTFSLKNIFSFSDGTDDLQVNGFVDSATMAADVLRFYQKRAYATAWIDKRGISKNGKQLLEELRGSKQEGLQESFYDVPETESFLSRIRDASVQDDSLRSMLAQLDVLMTTAYINFASDLLAGRIDPEELHVIWEVYPQKTDLAQYLENALQKKNISESLAGLRPAYEQYKLLKKAFGKLLEDQSKGGWPLPGDFPPLKENDSGANVIKLKKYLLATGDLRNNDSVYIHSPRFDRRLTEAVRMFQQRHGLKPDGVAARETAGKMNIPLQERIDQVRINLDRIRWLPESFGEKYIIINVPSFSFHYFEKGEPVLNMGVVVGKNENYTPILNDTLYSVIFNPSWNVPASIATKEMLPKIRKDPGYLKKNNYVLLKDSYVSKDTVNPQEVDWKEVTKEHFPYFIVQEPGKTNPLGKLEFMMLNQYNIYLHDTPADHLFSESQRDFSHGCIRLEKPAELAGLLLKEQIPGDTIAGLLAAKQKKRVVLKDKIPVHLIYQTAWVGKDGEIQFRDDIYDFDKLSLPLFRDLVKQKVAER